MRTVLREPWPEISKLGVSWWLNKMGPFAWASSMSMVPCGTSGSSKTRLDKQSFYVGEKQTFSRFWWDCAIRSMARVRWTHPASMPTESYTWQSSIEKGEKCGDLRASSMVIYSINYFLLFISISTKQPISNALLGTNHLICRDKDNQKDTPVYE